LQVFPFRYLVVPLSSGPGHPFHQLAGVTGELDKTYLAAAVFDQFDDLADISVIATAAITECVDKPGQLGTTGFTEHGQSELLV
jgi:hypothetical protein